MAFLYPNWTGYGSVRILHPDLSYWKEYTVGLAPTDLKLWQTTTHINDEVSPTVHVKVYPNPVKQGQNIVFELDQKAPAKLKIYNIKGQLLYSAQFREIRTILNSRIISDKAGCGCYLYQIKTGNSESTGKFIILD